MSVAEVEAREISFENAGGGGLWSEAWYRIRRNPGAIAGFVIALVVIAAVMLRGRRRRRALESAVGAAFDGHNVLSQGAPEAPAAPMPELDVTFTPGEESALKRQVAQVARDHPDEMAQLLRVWMFRRKTVVN